MSKALKKIPLWALEEKICHDLEEVKSGLQSQGEGISRPVAILAFCNMMTENIRDAFKEFVEENELQGIVDTGKEKISIHGEVGQGKYPFALSYSIKTGEEIKMSKKIELSVHTTSQVAVVSFELKDSIEPSELTDFVADLPEIPGDRIVIISGRGPIWLFGVIIHHYHYCQAIATHDPRLDGAVVIESHIRGMNVGDIVQLPAETKESVS